MYKGRGPYSYCHAKHRFDIFVKVELCAAMEIWKSPLIFATEILFEILACKHGSPYAVSKTKIETEELIIEQIPANGFEL